MRQLRMLASAEKTEVDLIIAVLHREIQRRCSGPPNEAASRVRIRNLHPFAILWANLRSLGLSLSPRSLLFRRPNALSRPDTRPPVGDDRCTSRRRVRSSVGSAKRF